MYVSKLILGRWVASLSAVVLVITQTVKATTSGLDSLSRDLLKDQSSWKPTKVDDTDYLNVALNVEYLEAEFFLASAYGKGLDALDSSLAGGGPPPRGGRKANVSEETWGLIEMMALEEVGHIRAIREYLGNDAIQRPQLDLSDATWTAMASQALGRDLAVPFSPYGGDTAWLLGAFALPYVGLTGYVGASPHLQHPASRLLVAGLEGMESGQDALLRTLIYAMRERVIFPYGLQVREVADSIAQLRRKLDGADVDKDPKLIVGATQGAQNRTSVNVLAGNKHSLSFERTPEEIFRVVYGTGDASQPGGFYPRGGNGKFADFYRSRIAGA